MNGNVQAGQPDAPQARTLADIARLAGVSAITVSRALRGSELVLPETRSRIQALARQHGYRVNQNARNLKLRRGSEAAGTVAVVVVVTTPEALQRGLASAANGVIVLDACDDEALVAHVRALTGR